MISFHEGWLCNFIDNDTCTVDCPHLSNMLKADFYAFLSDPMVEECYQHLRRTETTFITNENVNDAQLLSIAISSLQLFVQENFIGPPLNENCIQILKNFQQNSDITVDGEPMNSNVKHSQLLELSKFLLTQLRGQQPDSLILDCWMLRCLYIHQRILEAPANAIYEEFLTLAMEIEKKLNKELIRLETKSSILLELIQAFLFYKRIGHAKSLLNRCKDLLRTSINVEGVLGRRTKYQEKALPQMLLRVQSATDLPLPDVTHQSTPLPPLLKLNDEVRLEKITFESEDDNQIFALPSILQQLILAEIKYIQLSQPKDKLADEELQPYLTTLLFQNHGPWSCRMAGLLENIHFEKYHKRTVDRSLKQCEEVLHLIGKQEDCFVHRFSYAYQSYLRPTWEIKAQFGRLMISLGMIKTALDLYLEIQKWNEVIACYSLLELRHKAAEIIEQELKKRPTVELYCLLGDATDDVTFYERAWKLSGHRSGRAQRDWGFHYFAKKDYKMAIVHLQQSVEINSLQEDVWSRLGYAAISLENWSLAAIAYKRYTYIEPNGFESWNNLANAYIKLGQKPKAHKVLQEALKCNWNNWKVWENFLLVSTDTGHFEDVINAYNRLIELKGKYYDHEVLQILVNSIMGNVKDADDRPSERLHKKLQALVSHLCVQIPHDGPLWELAAQLAANEPLSKARKLQKVYQCYTQTQSSWSKNPDTSLKVLQICTDLCESSINAFEHRAELEMQATLSQLSSARLSGQAAVRIVTTENWENCAELLIGLNRLLDKIKNVLLQNK